MVQVFLCCVTIAAIAVWFTIIEPAAVNSIKRKEERKDNPNE